MRNDSKQIFYFAIEWLLGVAYLFFQYKNPQLFPETVRAFAAWGFGGALAYVTFRLLLELIKALPTFGFLFRPLWGMEKTPAGYRDVSLKNHPVLVVVLFGIILISWLFIFSLR